MEASQTVAVLTDLGNTEEFLSLTNEAGYAAAAELTVKKMTSHILSRYKLGKLKELVRQNGTDTVVFDLPLKPRQSYRIAKTVQARPLDRIDVILEIFRRHAPTQEANLQVKAASLSYELTRAKEKVRLAKTGEHPGFYGLGGYEVDVYYEEVRRRIAKIREKL
ncbi:MAG: GTPase HflX, partial [Candidatus Geothermarchaeales archaeon]